MSKIVNNKKKIKIEIEIPQEKYKEFIFLCKKTKQQIKEKAKEIFLNAINSSEIENF